MELDVVVIFIAAVYYELRVTIGRWLFKSSVFLDILFEQPVDIF